MNELERIIQQGNTNTDRNERDYDFHEVTPKKVNLGIDQFWARGNEGADVEYVSHGSVREPKQPFTHNDLDFESAKAEALAEGYKAKSNTFSPDTDYVSGLEAFGAAVKGGVENSLYGFGIREGYRALNKTVDARMGLVDSTFVPSFDQLKGFSADEQADLMQSYSLDDYNNRVTSILDRRHYAEKAAAADTGWGIAGSLVGGLVDAPLFAAGASGVARALHSAKAGVRYVAANTVPGLVGNAVQAYYDPYTHADQIIKGAIMDMIPVMASPALSRGRGYLAKNLDKAMQEMSSPEILKELDQPRQAVSGWVALGPEVKASDLAKAIDENIHTLKGQEDFFGNIDLREYRELSGNAVSHEALETFVKGGRIEGDKIVLDNVRVNDWLGKDQANMTNFKMFDDVVISNVNNAKMEELASVLSKDYLGGQKIILAKGADEGTAGQMTMLEHGFIGVRVGKNMTLDTLVHEIGHAVIAKRLGDKRMSAKVRADFIKDIKNIAKSFDDRVSFDNPKDAVSKVKEQYSHRYGSKPTTEFEGELRKHVSEVKKSSVIQKVLKSLSELWNYKFGDVKNHSEISAVSFQRYIKKTFDAKGIKVSDSTTKLLADEYVLFESSAKVSDLEARFFEESKRVSGESSITGMNDVSGQRSVAASEATSNMARSLETGKLSKDGYRGTAVEAYGLVDLGNSDTMKALTNAANAISSKALDEAPVRLDPSRISNTFFRWAFEAMTTEHWSVNWATRDLMSSGLIMRMSKNPTTRLYAQLLTEDASGLGGKRVKNAAILKELHQSFVLQNIVRENEVAFMRWAEKNGLNRIERYEVSKRNQYNRELSVEMNKAARGGTVNPLFAEIVESYSNLYGRVNKLSERLSDGLRMKPIKTYGFRPLKLNREAILELSEGQRAKLRTHIMGHLQSKGVKGDVGKQVNEFLNGTVEVEAIDPSMRFSFADFDPEKWDVDSSFRSEKAQAAFDKHQITADMFSDLDVTLRIDDSMTLGDVLDNNHLALARMYAERMSGLAALSDIGIVHPKILDAYIASAQRGRGDYAASDRDIRAMEQVKAELLGKRPDFATDVKWLNNLGSLMSSAQLGGATFSQAAETANILAHYGFDAGMRVFPEVEKALDDIRSLKKGEKLKTDGILRGLEEETGVLHAMEGYTNSTFFDQTGVTGDQALSYVGNAEGAIRGAAYVNMKINGMRLLGAMQSRAMANMISDYALTAAIKGGLDPKKMASLADAGFDETLLKRIKAEAKYTIKGDSIDINWKSLSKETLDDFNIAVTRGTKQVIQGDLVGERGAWAHSSLWRAALLYRRFPIVAMEKQLLRQGAVRGPAFFATSFAYSFALGSLMLSTRVYLNSLGREDAEEYRQKMLDPTKFPRMVLSYVGNLGVLYDLYETGESTFLGDEYGRGGLVGNKLFPGVGYVNDLYKAATLPKMLLEGDHETAFKTIRRVLPLGRVPGIVQGLNLIQSSLDDSDE
jgi:hypothetical protein|nr:MAG TPA: Internal virion protein D [Caudoviricetes sp.]